MKQLLLSLLLLCAAFAGGAQVPADTVPFDEENPRFLLAGQADQAIAEGKYEEAAARLIEAISICPACPDNVILLSNLGMVYATDGRNQEALDTFDGALRQAPRMRSLLNGRARVLLQMGRDADAYSAFGDLIAVDSLNTDARYYHGMLALYSGKLPEAEADFRVLADSLPDEPATARALSSLNFLTGNYGKAIRYYRTLVASEPEPEYYSALAKCYLAEGQLTEASETIGQALELYPEDAEIYYCRAWLNKSLFRPREAEEDGRKAVRLGIPQQRVDALLKSH